MKIFLDSASTSEIEELNGRIDGVTTNPTLIAKEIDKKGVSGSAAETLRALLPIDICKQAPANVSLEVLSTNYEGMLREGRALAQIDPDKVVVKVPIGVPALKAIRAFSAEGIRTNCTLVFTPMQALLAAKAGATYVSPFLGRLEAQEAGSGFKCLTDIKTIFENYNVTTQILAASVRHVEHIAQIAAIGIDALTCSYALLNSLHTHPLTDKGLATFLADYQRTVS